MGFMHAHQQGIEAAELGFSMLGFGFGAEQPSYANQSGRAGLFGQQYNGKLLADDVPPLKQLAIGAVKGLTRTFIDPMPAVAAMSLDPYGARLAAEGNAALESNGGLLAYNTRGQREGALMASVGLSLFPAVGVVGDVARCWSSVGMFGADSSRLIVNIDRISSNVVNKPFITEEAKGAGWDTPYPKDLTLRKITLGKDLKLYRVHTDETWPYGRFLAREKEVIPFLNDPESLRIHLGLPDVPIYITEVNVPANTELLVGRIGAQKNFGLLEESGFQYQLQHLSDIPRSSYTNTRQILESGLNLGF